MFIRDSVAQLDVFPLFQRVRLITKAVYTFPNSGQARSQIGIGGKVYFRSQILERPSIGEYWYIFCLPVLPENVLVTFFRTCWCYSEAYNTGTQKWSSIVQYLCTSIWDLMYTFSGIGFNWMISILK